MKSEDFKSLISFFFFFLFSQSKEKFIDSSNSYGFSWCIVK